MIFNPSLAFVAWTFIEIVVEVEAWNVLKISICCDLVIWSFGTDKSFLESATYKSKWKASFKFLSQQL